MLFDLRGRGRRTTVRVVYIGLAVLLGGSLIFLGVGTGFGGGGFLNAVGENEGSGGASFANQIKKYERQTKEQPRNVRAWENLTNAQLHEASGEAYVSSTGALTSKGRELYAQVARSWSSYLALNPSSPNPTLAQQMVRVYGEEGLNQPAEAVKVLQIVTATRPGSSALFAELAEYAYRAHNVSLGDLASQKAVTLAPAVQRPRLKTVLAALKKTVKSGASGNYTSTGAAPTLTTPHAPAGQSTTPTK